MPLLFIIPVIKMFFFTIVLPGVFVMARLECCRETETAIFATRTNLPVSDFQTWQVWTLYHFVRKTVDPPRSRDSHDGGHMTTVVYRRSGEFISLVMVHGRFSYFNSDGFSHFPPEPTVTVLSCSMMSAPVETKISCHHSSHPSAFAHYSSVLPRLLLQGAAPCPLFVTPCPFEKAEMTPCPFD